MKYYRRRRYVEPVGDLLVDKTFDHKCQHVAFALREQRLQQLARRIDRHAVAARVAAFVYAQNRFHDLLLAAGSVYGAEPSQRERGRVALDYDYRAFAFPVRCVPDNKSGFR